MACIVDQLMSVKDNPKVFRDGVEKALKDVRVGPPLTVTLNSETPYIMKAIIDQDEYVVIINPVKLKRASAVQVGNVIKKEFNKIFLSEIKVLTKIDSMLKFLSEFGFSIAMFGGLYRKVRTKFNSDIKATLILSISTLLFNIIYDLTIQKFIDRKVLKKRIYDKFWSKLGCNQDILEFEYVGFDKLLFEFSITTSFVNFLIRKIKNLDKATCKTLNWLFRISSKIFGPVAPISERLYKLQRDCREG